MTRSSRIVLLVLHTYPQWWRVRYGDEMDAVIEDLIETGQSSIRIARDLLSGSWRARMLGSDAPATREF